MQNYVKVIVSSKPVPPREVAQEHIDIIFFDDSLYAQAQAALSEALEMASAYRTTGLSSRLAVWRRVPSWRVPEVGDLVNVVPQRKPHPQRVCAACGKRTIGVADAGVVRCTQCGVILT